MYNKNVNGVTVTVDEEFPEIDVPIIEEQDRLLQLTAGLSEATTIKQIREVAQSILNATAGGRES